MSSPPTGPATADPLAGTTLVNNDSGIDDVELLITALSGNAIDQAVFA
jgi:hypothetical protein